MSRQLQIAHVGNRVIVTVTETDERSAERQYDAIIKSAPEWIDHLLPRPPRSRYAVEARAGNVVVTVRPGS